MVRVMKSPNMMSTTGRRPLMAAPTASPVKPASEMGVSRTRSLPNSSTKPERTLNGVPASATSSPKMQTRESRRISSARASRTACANVSSRSGIDVLFHLIDAGIGRCNAEFHSRFHLGARLSRNLIEECCVGVPLRQQPSCMQLDGIALRFPVLLFLLRAVILAIDVADVMPAVAVGIGLQKCRPMPGPRTLYQSRCDFIDRAHILAVNRGGSQPEGFGASQNRSGGRLRKMGVFVVK